MKSASLKRSWSAFPPSMFFITVDYDIVEVRGGGKNAKTDTQLDTPVCLASTAFANLSHVILKRLYFTKDQGNYLTSVKNIRRYV